MKSSLLGSRKGKNGVKKTSHGGAKIAKDTEIIEEFVMIRVIH